MIDYNIISTGSKGNCVQIAKHILIDLGVPFKKIEEIYNDISIVLLTHIHSDHFNKSTIKKLASERPTLRFGCCQWLVDDLILCGVDISQIDVFEVETIYDYGSFKVTPYKLFHNVPNCGYSIVFDNGDNLFYATDTNSLSSISLKNYSLYLIEANYGEKEILERIREKENDGVYVYEKRVLKNHLSIEKAEKWLANNMGENSMFEFLHGHENKK